MGPVEYNKSSRAWKQKCKLRNDKKKCGWHHGRQLYYLIMQAFAYKMQVHNVRPWGSTVVDRSRAVIARTGNVTGPANG